MSSAPHAPYILPDGLRLTQYINASVPGGKKSKKPQSALPGKHHLWGQLQNSKQRGNLSESELAELRVLERVGNRRRTRWLNDKVLRDMAGHMTAGDMEAQFKPAPFGEQAPPSAFTRAMAPEHAAIWVNFISVDMDKEARVLERWAQHNAGLRSGGSASSSGDSEGASTSQPAASPAAVALTAWCSVGKPARAALKRANVHSVMDFEMQIVEWLEQAEGDPAAAAAELALNPEDAFGRLLVHGLAQFHGLSSATRGEGASKRVLVSRRQLAGGSKQPAAGVLARGPDSLLCTDVLMALHEIGSSGGFDASSLGRFVRHHVHGVVSDAPSEDYVMV